MSKKCIYKDCTSIGSGEITLFAFPKDPQRRNIWLQSAGYSTTHILQKTDCICELHFGRQFISSNQRRKVLVGVAVPMDQSQSHQNHHSDDEIEALEDCERLDMAEIFDHGQQHDTDLDSFRSNSVMEHVTVEDYVPDKIVCDERQQRPPHIERMKRTSDHLTPNGANPLKLIKIDVNRTKLTNGTDTVQKTLQAKDGVKPRPPVTSVIDHPDVSIFNIRGEEFIQMPKSVYLEEKTKLQNSQAEAYVQEIKALREELNQYKGAVQAIKNHLRPLK